MRIRRRALCLSIASLAVTLAVGASSASGARGGIDGEVVDVTCYGPCMVPPPPPRPYVSEQLRVSMRRIASGELVRVVRPEDGRFRARLRRGRYRVRAYVPGDSCIEGDVKDVRVRRHEFSAVTLEVGNSCIL